MGPQGLFKNESKGLYVTNWSYITFSVFQLKMWLHWVFSFSCNGFSAPCGCGHMWPLVTCDLLFVAGDGHFIDPDL